MQELIDSWSEHDRMLNLSVLVAVHISIHIPFF